MLSELEELELLELEKEKFYIGIKEPIFSEYIPPPPKPVSKEDIVQIIRYEIEKALSKIKPQEKIVEKIIKEVPTETKTVIKELDEETKNSLLKNINDLREELRKSEEKLKSYVIASVPMPGGSGVIGIPSPGEASESDVLTVVNKKAKWKASSGTGGLTSGTYSVSNPTTERSFDADNTTLDELADVVATLISDLGGL